MARLRRLQLSVFYSIQIDQWYTQPTFYMLLLKFMGLVLIGSFWDYQNIIRDLRTELVIIAAVAPVVMILQQWITIRRRVHGITAALMVKVIVLQFSFAAVLAAVRGHDFSKMEAQAISRTPDLALDLKVPPSSFSVPAYFFSGNENDVYVARRRDNGKISISAGTFESNYVSLDGLIQSRVVTRENNGSIARRGIRLIADRELPIRTIEEVIHAVALAGDRTIQFSVNDPYSIAALPMQLIKPCEADANTHGDSQMTNVSTPCVPPGNVSNLPSIHFGDDEILLNDTVRSVTQVAEWLEWELKAERDALVQFRLSFDSSLHYGTFIQQYESLVKTAFEVTAMQLKSKFGIDAYTPGEILDTPGARVEVRFNTPQFLILTKKEIEAIKSLLK